MITIYGELYSSKNRRTCIRPNKKSKRIISIKSNEALKQFNDSYFQCVSKQKEFHKMMEGKTFPVKIQFKIYRRTHNRFDYTNIIQNLCDAMVKAQLIPDDSAKYLIPFYEPYEKDAHNPRTEITIL